MSLRFPILYLKWYQIGGTHEIKYQNGAAYKYKNIRERGYAARIAYLIVALVDSTDPFLITTFNNWLGAKHAPM